MEQTKYSVGQYLIDRLTQLNLGHLFSIAGDYTIQWVNNFVEPSPVEVIEEVNELNATFAADGYARLKGISAVCFTYSAGTLSAVNATAAAYVEKVPIVVINGAPNIKQRLTFEQTGFSAHHLIKGDTDFQIYKNITVAAIKIDHPGSAPRLIDHALTACITEKRPIYIELLDDMIYEACEPPKGELKALKPISDANGLQNTISILKDKLEKAEKPLLWIGVEVDRFELHEKVEALIKQLNIPYVTELISKAVLSENDPQFAGVYDGQASSASTQTLIESSDFVLGLGVWLTDINVLGAAIDYDKSAFVSFDTLKYGTEFIPQVALEDVVDGLVASKVTCDSKLILEKPKDIPEVNLQDQITYQGFYNFIQENEYVSDQTLVGSDASLNYFGNILLKVGAPRGFIAQSYYSAIGYIGPAATGMSLAKEADQRVMVFTGDGGFQMCVQCLSTQTRFGLNPIIFIMDNGVYGVEQWLYDASVFSSDKPFFNSCILHRWEYSKLSDVFGCKGWKVTTYEALQVAIKEAMENVNSPSVIQVVIPDKSLPENATWKKD